MANPQPFLFAPDIRPLQISDTAASSRGENSSLPKRKVSTARFSSIDILRTIAIQVMVFVHFSENLSGYTPPITGLGAPLFAILSGVSYFLWVRGQQERGRSEEDISKVSIRRGLFVFGVGIAFNVLMWMPEGTFNWDVLTLIGSALLILNLVRNLPVTIMIFIAALVLLVSPALRIQTEYPLYWENKFFEYDMTFSDVVSGYFATGYFPIFPWLSFSLTGFATASLLFAEDEDDLGQAEQEAAPRVFPRKLLLAGSALLAAGLTAYFARPYLPEMIGQHFLGGWTMFPTTIEYALGMIGIDLILLSLLHYYVDLNPNVPQRGRWLDIAKTFSQYSLTIYVLHHVVHLWPLWLYAVAKSEDDPMEYWMQATTTPVALALAAVFLVVCFFLMRWIGPDRRFGIEAWMRWLCD